MSENDAASQWRRCSGCKGPIAFGAIYWVCNVSTCNRRNTAFVFCTVSCWDSHLGIVRHRESWAVEERAPSRAQHERAQAAAPGASRVQGGSSGASAKTRGAGEREVSRAGRRSIPAAGSPASEPPRETLIVASKLKQYVKAKSGLNTSERVLGPLSDAVRRLCDEAIENAVADERKTILDRDFKRR